MTQGRVRWFSNAFGYGFIEDGQGRDIFVHFSVIQKTGYKTLADGQEVSFEVADGPKGQHATIVVIANDPQAIAIAA